MLNTEKIFVIDPAVFLNLQASQNELTDNSERTHMHTKMHKHKVDTPASLQWLEVAIKPCCKTLYRKITAARQVHVCVCAIVCPGCITVMVQTLNSIPSCAYTEPRVKINTVLHFIYTM